MASKQLVCLCTLAIFPALAQVQLNSPFANISPPFATTSIVPRFNFHADPPAGIVGVDSGTSTRSLTTMNQAYTVVHRYFYDQQAHTYFGYDAVIKPDAQGNAYDVTYYDLSIGPLDFGPIADGLDPTKWSKQPLPSIPATQTIKASDSADVVVSVDATTGRKLIDTISFAQGMRSIIFSQNPTQMFYSTSSVARGTAGSMPTPPTVSGEAREFAVDDAELRLQRSRVTFNGKSLEVNSRGVSGALVWFYVPEHGRYVLSLAPRAELGFVKAGEIRGGVVKFTLENDSVVLESPASIAPGEAPYLLYVLHDPEWAPTAQGQSNNLLVGSVSTGELSALRRK